jgi:hypothetical protein
VQRVWFVEGYAGKVSEAGISGRHARMRGEIRPGCRERCHVDGNGMQYTREV